MGPFTDTASEIIAVYERYADMLFRVAYTLLCSREDAEDAVSEVFYKYMTKKPCFETDEHEKAWLLRVTINQAHDLQRKRVRQSYTPLDEIAELPAKEQEYFEALRDVISPEVQSLPEKFKTVLLLFYYEELKIEEIASVLKISQAAVKMRLNRGRECLKKKLKEDEADD